MEEDKQAPTTGDVRREVETETGKGEVTTPSVSLAFS